MRQAYRFQFDPLIEAGLIKDFPELGLMAVLKAEGVELEVYWRKKVKRKTKGGIKEYQRFFTVLNHYPRGVLLFPHWEIATPEEKEECSSLPEDELKRRRVFRQNNSFSVRKVMCINNLSGAVRQRKRHIIRDLIGVSEKGFFFPGDAMVLAKYAARMADIIKPLLAARIPSRSILSEISVELSANRRMLEKSKASLLKQADREMRLAEVETFWGMALHGSKALSAILGERARKYDMAVKSWVLGEKWQNLYEGTIASFCLAYERMGKLIENLSQEVAAWQRGGVAPDINKVKELHGIYLHLSCLDGSFFNPFYQRIASEEFQALDTIVARAEQDKWTSILGIAKKSHSKIQVFARGEIPTKEETAQAREIF